MTDLYDQRIDAMKARERIDGHKGVDGLRWYERPWPYDEPVSDGWQANLDAQDERNPDRLAAYKRKRAEYV